MGIGNRLLNFLGRGDGPSPTDTDPTLVAFYACHAADATYRTAKDREDTVALLEYYERRAEGRVARVNKHLGCGVLDVANHRPIQVPLTRYAIARQAVVYARPPTRWLLGTDGNRLSDTGPQTK